MRFRGPMVGPRVDFRHVASSHLLEPPFAYKYCRVWSERKQIENWLGFLFFCYRLGFSVSFILYFLFFYRSCIRADLIQREIERDIDVIDGDNLCKGVSFLLHCNLLHLLHDA